MKEWIDTDNRLPDEKELVTIRVHGAARPACYRIADRWYSMVDLERWQMNTSPYWEVDRSWYLRTEQIRGWRPGE